MKTMTWTKRITLSAGLALTSLVAVPAVAGADGCYTGCTPPTVSSTLVAPPSTDPVHHVHDHGPGQRLLVAALHGSRHR